MIKAILFLFAFLNVFDFAYSLNQQTLTCDEFFSNPDITDKYFKNADGSYKDEQCPYPALIQSSRNTDQPICKFGVNNVDCVCCYNNTIYLESGNSLVVNLTTFYLFGQLQAASGSIVDISITKIGPTIHHGLLYMFELVLSDIIRPQNKTYGVNLNFNVEWNDTFCMLLYKNNGYSNHPGDEFNLLRNLSSDAKQRNCTIKVGYGPLETDSVCYFFKNEGPCESDASTQQPAGLTPIIIAIIASVCSVFGIVLILLIVICYFQNQKFTPKYIQKHIVGKSSASMASKESGP